MVICEHLCDTGGMYEEAQLRSHVPIDCALMQIVEQIIDLRLSLIKARRRTGPLDGINLPVANRPAIVSPSGASSSLKSQATSA